MAHNGKLTRKLVMRQVDAIHFREGIAYVDFTDGSTLVVNTPDGFGKVQNVRQHGIVVILDFFSGGDISLQMMGPTSSVMLRDKKGDLEYSD